MFRKLLVLGCFGAVLYFGMADRHNLPMPEFWNDIAEARGEFLEDVSDIDIGSDSERGGERRSMADVVTEGQEFAIDTARNMAADEASRRIWSDLQRDPSQRGGGSSKTPSPDSGDEIMQDAFDNRLHDVQVEGEGRVTRILSDDDEGSRHQRFIVELANGLTVMVAHNIDLAPRVAGIETGDLVSFYGEYEWNERGGVMHWTHDDPDGRHVGGWVEHRGRVYK